MTNPTRKEIRDAYDSLSNLAAFASRYAEDMGVMNQILGWNETIGAVLPPRPQTTMAAVEWDDDKHYLAEAEHPDFGKVIMLGRNAYSRIDFFAPERYASRFKDTGPENLTPTGKRYTLTEVQDD